MRKNCKIKYRCLNKDRYKKISFTDHDYNLWTKNPTDFYSALVQNSLAMDSLFSAI